ncbi:hypothetical protein D5274_06260 [bacterium 1XD42-94]|nr:hypothetical protein [bacterium 1XD42-76]NBK04776.1 hypothetical protein [bacterium 1XD42-94]
MSRNIIYFAGIRILLCRFPAFFDLIHAVKDLFFVCRQNCFYGIIGKTICGLLAYADKGCRFIRFQQSVLMIMTTIGIGISLSPSNISRYILQKPGKCSQKCACIDTNRTDGLQTVGRTLAGEVPEYLAGKDRLT